MKVYLRAHWLISSTSVRKTLRMFFADGQGNVGAQVALRAGVVPNRSLFAFLAIRGRTSARASSTCLRIANALRVREKTAGRSALLTPRECRTRSATPVLSS